MAEQNSSGSGQSGSLPKAIGSLAKRQEDVTRRGTSKMKFTPTLPARRKKEEPKPEVKVDAAATDGRGRGRGRGRGDRGRGGARGGAPRAPPEMVASGPFALGPAITNSSTRRAAPRSNFAPLAPLGSSSSTSLGAGLTKSTAPSLKREPRNNDQEVIDVDTYSDPEDGVEIVDMDDVRRMDWMAPESLRKEKVKGKKKRKVSVKKEEGINDKGKVKAEPEDVDIASEEDEQVDLANALDLSDSEEEEELEDIINDFALQEEDLDSDMNVRQEKLYFFQFPEPFPTFLPRDPPQPQDVDMAETFTTQIDKGKAPEGSDKNKKAVSFAADVKPPASGTSTPASDGAKKEEQLAPPLDGIIGRLEIHQSGTVRMRLENGILLDVTAATQPSFLQHAMHIDMEKKRMNVLGEVNRRFVVSPNIEALLGSLELSEQQAAMEVDTIDEGLIKMEPVKEKEKEKEKPKPKPKNVKKK